MSVDSSSIPNGMARFLLSLVAGFAIVFTASVATAQDPPQYDVLPLYKHNNNREIATLTEVFSLMPDDLKNIRKMLDAGVVDQAAFDKFFNDIVFPMFTHEKAFKHPVLGATPAKMRQGFKKVFVTEAKNSGAKQRLFDLTLAKMEQIATGNFHPWVRINAAFMIAELNESEPVPPLNEPGPPLKKAYPILFKWGTDPKMADVVRIPAMQGLLRHAAAKPSAVAAEDRTKLLTSMLVIAKQHTAIPEQSLEGHEWMLRRSIDILAALGVPGDKNVVVDELLKIVDDEAAPRSARADATAALAKIKFTPPKDFDVEGYAKSLGKLAVAAYKAELADYAATKRQSIAVERLKQQLAEIRKGLASENGKNTAAIFTTDVLKKFAADIIAQLDAMTKACDTPLDFDGQNKALSDPNSIPNVPYDLQQTIAKAISTAGAALEAVLQAGPGGNVPRAGVPAEPPGVVPPPPGGAVKPAPVVAPKVPAAKGD